MKWGVVVFPFPFCPRAFPFAIQGWSVWAILRNSKQTSVNLNDAVREFANKSAASAASPDYVKFQAVIKSAATAAFLRAGRASGRLDHNFFFFTIFGPRWRPKNTKEHYNLRLCPTFQHH